MRISGDLRLYLQTSLEAWGDQAVSFSFVPKMPPGQSAFLGPHGTGGSTPIWHPWAEEGKERIITRSELTLEERRTICILHAWSAALGVVTLPWLTDFPTRTSWAPTRRQALGLQLNPRWKMSQA